MDPLTKQQENFCDNGGLFGIMISSACLAQHLFFMIPHWITFTVIAVYLLCITGFVLLMKKSVTALPVLFTSVVLVFLLEAFMLITLTFSFLLMLLLVYLSVIFILFYTGTIQKKLKEKMIAEKEEAAKWNGIL